MEVDDAALGVVSGLRVALCRSQGPDGDRVNDKAERQEKQDCKNCNLVQPGTP